MLMWDTTTGLGWLLVHLVLWTRPFSKHPSTYQGPGTAAGPGGVSRPPTVTKPEVSLDPRRLKGPGLEPSVGEARVGGVGRGYAGQCVEAGVAGSPGRALQVTRVQVLCKQEAVSGFDHRSAASLVSEAPLGVQKVPCHCLPRTAVHLREQRWYLYTPPPPPPFLAHLWLEKWRRDGHVSSPCSYACCRCGGTGPDCRLWGEGLSRVCDSGSLC